ncbi:FAD-dependent oxidoreductase [Clostridium sp. CCUG 7971]|uniref:FAD-dependent oxidoreductase n=1 Tax=Clostridium sp. CCUG 7971 TaxID=2811414 RepID=UPI001ABA9F63|nr:FAD-dependent oxidoreductase [Clostridium sp. CCUG 7971]MBO3444736.1 FAD-dependent oxidoreductase [Clostridium sp. CCUG 7971]
MSKVYDLIIIGGGPAGISASIYAGRAKLNTLVIEKESCGGQIKTTSEIVNYPGIRQSSGPYFMEEMKQQALDFNVKFKEDEVLNVDLDSDIKIIKTKSENLKSRSVIIATGASPRKLGFTGEEKFTGRGIAYCATCDGEFFKGLEVFVVGAGFAAAEESLFLTKFARKVTVVAREPEFTCAKSIADKVKSHPKIEVKFNTEIIEAGGDGVLQYAKFKNNETNEVFEYTASEKDGSFGIFIFIGYKPQTGLFKGKVDLDNYGYILTNENMETNVRGVYAAGDLRPKELRQVVTAVADGAIAATRAEKFVSSEKERLGIKEEIIEESTNTSKVVENNAKEELNSNVSKRSSLLNDTLRSQLKGILDKIENDVTLVTVVDESLQKSLELRDLVIDIADLCEKLHVEVYKKSENLDIESKINADKLPVVALLDSNKNYCGVKFHGVPGGHELNSFILAIYNLGGPGQNVDKEIIDNIKDINRKTNIKVAVSLSCNLCPDVVIAAQRIAIENENIEAEMVNISEFDELKSKHKIMSVPGIIINDEDVYFGAKKITEIVSLIK